jgi:hypothetical protein
MTNKKIIEDNESDDENDNPYGSLEETINLDDEDDGQVRILMTIYTIFKLSLIFLIKKKKNFLPNTN